MKEKIKTILQFVGGVILGVAILFAVWVFLWTCNDLGFTM